MNKNKKAIAALIALICLLAFVLSTWAYFTDEQRTRNYITTGEVAIEVHEYADDAMTVPFPTEGISGVMPGESVTKIVVVENTGSSPAWIRVKADKAITLAQGVEGAPDTSLILLDIDTSAWSEQDGWYYLDTALEPGETTPPLFRHVEFDASMQNLYRNSKAEVSITAQAVQTANNGESAATALGWPETTEGE
ncbi:MAG: SipW-dependent-type signal peptide-containing protein [Firmicutes bacterium]|nr:SipW-dependent-type signal peptide-containing protein [Bacillota bacterium]